MAWPEETNPGTSICKEAPGHHGQMEEDWFLFYIPEEEPLSWVVVRRELVRVLSLSLSLRLHQQCIEQAFRAAADHKRGTEGVGGTLFLCYGAEGFLRWSVALPFLKGNVQY